MRVLFFAQLKDATHCDSVEFAVSAALTVEELWSELLKKFPALAAHRASVRLAKNHEYVGLETTFANDDEVALIPPVSGG
jgi:molybdopterin converting factor subunit 1